MNIAEWSIRYSTITWVVTFVLAAVGMIAFEAAVILLKECGKSDVLASVYCKCVECLSSDQSCEINYVKEIYAPFTDEQISRKISEIVYPKDMGWDGEVTVIYQTVEGLRKALPNHRGDWYFTGDFPTPGGYRVVNQAFVNYYEKSTGRSY